MNISHLVYLPIAPKFYCGSMGHESGRTSSPLPVKVLEVRHKVVAKADYGKGDAQQSPTPTPLSTGSQLQRCLTTMFLLIFRTCSRLFRTLIF